MRVCVVGGTGHISTSIVALLLEVGHEVTVFNRGKSSRPPAGVKEIRGDRSDRASFEAAMQAQHFDAAIDMMCFDAQDAQSTLRAFRGVKHLVHCSSVATYGVQYDWLPVTEDHPLRATGGYGLNKVAADGAMMEAYYREGFPVTILKPSTTYGPRWPLLRQIAWHTGWIDRVRSGKPIIICGDGRALHQWLYVDDAAPAFVFALGRERCIGQTYNVVTKDFGCWADYHRTAMKAIGREVEMVGVPLANLLAAKVPNVGICETFFSHNTVFSPDKLMRDVPEFRPRVSLEEGMTRVLAAMDRGGAAPAVEDDGWEDRLIAAQRKVGEAGG